MFKYGGCDLGCLLSGGDAGINVVQAARIRDEAGPIFQLPIPYYRGIGVNHCILCETARSDF